MPGRAGCSTGISRGEGDHLPRASRSVCPECHRVVDCQLVVRGGQVWMEKACPDHGPFEALVSSSASRYIEATRFERPGREPLQRRGRAGRGCPHDCGLCPSHRQHTCVGVIEVTSACDLGCPVCFAGSGAGEHLPLETVVGMVDTLVECEGEVEVLQLSGGEPTAHPDILEILRYAGREGVRYPMLNTNGLRLADPGFARAVSGTVPDGGPGVGTPVVYLQFDGVTEGPHEALRGRPLLAEKLRAIENCRRFGMSVVLVPTLVRGVNDHQAGAMVEMALSDPAIKGVNFQPAARVGRYEPGGGGDGGRLTVPDVVDAIDEQTGGAVGADSFVAVPCPHPACSVCSYVYRDEERTLTVLDLVDTDLFMRYMADQAVPFGQVVSETLGTAASAISLEDLAGEDAVGLPCCPTGLRVPDLGELVDRVTLVTVHAFMDGTDLDLERASKCCVTQVLPDGRMVPFCVYNTLHRGREGAVDGGR